MNPRERMRISNGHAVKYLLENGFHEVWLKAHTKFSDIVYSMLSNYKALDLFNLWDGIALHEHGVYFVQIKTNAWAKEEPIIQWCDKYHALGLSINVKYEDNISTVLIKSYGE